ncbi:MAG TPA: alpha/beta hydrolase-fold protein [Jatrophihabitans sp.]|nr:alpha/beta hydrolase-fold protein [Jatrophihabitans sp.]
MADQPDTRPASRGRIVSRRTLLGAGALAAVGVAAGAAGVEQGILPGRSWLYAHLGLDGRDGQLPDVRPGQVISGSFVSRRRNGVRCGWSIGYPPGNTTDLPVLVVLHGRGGNHSSAFGNDLGLQYYLAQLTATGKRPFAIASVDGGDTYWHQRRTGENSGAMVTDELLPMLRTRGLRTNRIALLGWSMGGYGALLLAGMLGSARVSTCVAESPALWLHAGDTAPGAFDDAADYTAHTVFGHQQDLRGIAVRVDCGTGDGFINAAEHYVKGFPRRPAGEFSAGGHTLGYWRRMAPAQLAFVSDNI